MIGERLGKWLIFRELGRGGMGRVYLAQEEIGGRQAALKVLAAELAQDSGFLQRFQREIDALEKLDHPNIVRFYEAGFENGLYFYAMEYVDGRSLEEVLQERGRLPWREALDIARQLCKALRQVHDYGIIHRDLKPLNILCRHDGQLKLSDFGIAKVFAGGHLTVTGGIVGTAEYLSPEQAAGKPVSKRSDLYSFGIVLYAMLTGRTPFQGNSCLELLHKHRYAQFDRPRAIVPELPHELDELVCQLLEKEPEKRPADCLVLGRELERLQAKLERQKQLTVISENVTKAATQEDEDEGEPQAGPATLMSRLVRAELEQQNRPHFLSRLLNRPWVLVPLLAACLGALVWTFWPLGPDALFERGAALMATAKPADWELAWREYLEPLERRFPGHAYQEEVAGFRKKIEAARLAEHTPSDAQRFFQQGERLRQEGHFHQAQQVWRNLVTVFSGVAAEEEWVRRAQKSLDELAKVAAIEERWQRLRPALERAAALRAQGQHLEAEKIWMALEALYRDDPWAQDILQAIALARARKK